MSKKSSKDFKKFSKMLFCCKIVQYRSKKCYKLTFVKINVNLCYKISQIYHYLTPVFVIFDNNAKSSNTNSMKRFLCILVLAMIFPLFVGFSSNRDKVIGIEITARGEVVLSGEYLLNPKVDEDSLIVLSNSVDTYGEIGILNYMFFDLGDRLQEVYDSLDDIKVEDCIRFVPKSREKFFYDEGISSSWVKRGEVVDKVLEGLDSGKIKVDLDFVEGDNRYDTTTLREYTDKKASFSTNYSASSSGRKANILRACNFISGYVLGGGESFSFNQVVGKRTRERGFLDAKVIVDGNYVDGVGGGVCQVATTLYNTAIRSGARIDRCVRHTLAPSYVDMSFDAMVSEWADLVFTNPFDYPMFIEAQADGEKLTVTFYGKRGEEEYMFESVVKEVVRHPLYDGTNGEVYRNGYKSEGYKIVTKGGRVVSRERIRSDYYKPYEVKRIENNGNLE